MISGYVLKKKILHDIMGILVFICPKILCIVASVFRRLPFFVHVQVFLVVFALCIFVVLAAKKFLSSYVQRLGL